MSGRRVIGCNERCTTAASRFILVKVPVAADFCGDAQLYGARDHGTNLRRATTSQQVSRHAQLHSGHVTMQDT